MSKYETTAGIPTRGETYARLLASIRDAQDQAAMLAHLHNTEDSAHDKASARGWLMIEEQLKRFAHVVTEIATRGLF